MYSLGDLMSYGGSSSRSVDAPVSVAGLIIGLLLGLGGITLFVLYLIKAIKTRKTLMIVGASLGIVGCGLLIPAIIGIASSIKNHWSEIGEWFTGVSAPVITLMRLWWLFLVLGVVFLGAGIPLMIIGKRQMPGQRMNGYAQGNPYAPPQQQRPPRNRAMPQASNEYEQNVFQGFGNASQMGRQFFQGRNWIVILPAVGALLYLIAYIGILANSGSALGPSILGLASAVALLLVLLRPEKQAHKLAAVPITLLALQRFEAIMTRFFLKYADVGFFAWVTMLFDMLVIAFAVIYWLMLNGKMRNGAKLSLPILIGVGAIALIYFVEGIIAMIQYWCFGLDYFGAVFTLVSYGLVFLFGHFRLLMPLGSVEYTDEFYRAPSNRPPRQKYPPQDMYNNYGQPGPQQMDGFGQPPMGGFAPPQPAPQQPGPQDEFQPPYQQQEEAPDAMPGLPIACPNCGMTSAAGTIICPNCGVSLRRRYRARNDDAPEA